MDKRLFWQLVYVAFFAILTLAALVKGDIRAAGSILVGAIIFSPLAFCKWGGDDK